MGASVVPPHGRRIKRQCLANILSITLGMLISLLAIVAVKADIPTIGPGKWYLRVTIPKSAPVAVCPRIYFNPNLDPWLGDTLYVSRTGTSPTVFKEADWLKPGQTSGWVDIGNHMSANPTFKGSMEYLAPVFVAAVTKLTRDDLDLRIEIARGEEKSIVRTVAMKDPHAVKLGNSTWLGGEALPTVGLLIPASPDSHERIRTLEEASAEQLKWIESFGPKPTLSTHVWFISHQALLGIDSPVKLHQLQVKILRRLGFANMVQYASSPAELNALQRQGVALNQTREVQLDADIAAGAEAATKAGLLPYTRIVNFGDEIDLDIKASPAAQDAAFVAELRRRGNLHAMDFIRPADIARASGLSEEERWKLVSMHGALPADRPQLLFEAATFRYRLWSREMAARTAEVLRLYPAGVETGANFSPHLAVWPDVRKWIDPFRDGAMTMPWSEDWWWQVPEVSPQSYGYLLDALRHASDYHGAPYCFYTIPDNGETAADLLRMSYFALGHQAKVIDEFAIYNQAFGTCDYVDFLESKEKFRTMHRIMTDVGKIDARLAAVRARKAEIAIVMPVANDVWNTEDLLTDPKQDHARNLYYADLNVDNHERKALWLALRHAQYPVDLITDEDIAAGGLSHYKVIYLVGQELLSTAVDPMVRWVQAGGTLVAESGGGLLNQYREPQPEMLRLYGLTDSHLQRTLRSLSPATDLSAMMPLETVQFQVAKTAVPAFCSVQTFVPVNPKSAVAFYHDGSPAAVEYKTGTGKTLICGALLGLAYVRPALGGSGHLPTLFDANVRRQIVAPVEAAGIRRPIEASDPLVDVTLQEGPLGAIITLTDFRTDARKPVTITLNGIAGVRSVRSIRRGNLPIRQSPQGVSVTLSLDIGDFLLIGE